MSDELEELGSASPAYPSPSPTPAPMPMMGPQPADPRLYRFFWCAMACLVGVVFPFTSSHPEWKADVFNRALQGPAGTGTFEGALIGFSSLLIAAQYWWCMKYRRVKLWPLIVMLLVTVGAWTAVMRGLDAKLMFDWKDKAKDVAATAVPGGAWADIRFWNSFFTHIGAGWLLVLVGSTAFVLSFIGALVGAGKKPAAAAPAGRRR